MKSVFLLHPLLDLFICSLTLGGGQIQLIHINLNADMMLCLRKFGQKTYRLIGCRFTWGNIIDWFTIISDREFKMYRFDITAFPCLLIRVQFYAVDKRVHEAFLLKVVHLIVTLIEQLQRFINTLLCKPLLPDGL